MNKPLRVLIVEDSEEDALLLLHALRREGYEVVYEVVDTPSAMRAALDCQDWDVITSDHAMPHFSAQEALALAKELRPSLPFIIVSGEIDLNLAVALMRGGAQDYIQKRELPRIVPAIERALKDAESIIKRKQAEEALRESEELYRTFINATSDMVFLKDEQFRNIVINKSLATFLGKPAREIIGKSDFELMPQIAAEKCRQTDMEALSNQSIVISEEIVGDQWYQTVKFPVELGCNRIGVGGLIRNVTERKQVEETLRESEMRWQFALEGAGDGVWDWNVETNKVFFSRQWKKMLGFEEHEIGDTVNEWDKRVHPDDKSYVYEEIRKHFDGETQIYMSEHRVLCKNGSYKWILDRGKVIEKTEEGKPKRVIGTHTDITARKRSEEELRDSEERYRILAENSPSMIFLLDAHGNVLILNEKSAAQFGMKPEDIIGRNIRDLFPESIAERHMHAIKKVIRDGEMIHSELVETFPTGEKWIDARIAPVRDKNGEVIAVLGISHDITERKRMEKDLSDSEKRYRELSIVDDLSQLYNSRYFYHQLKLETDRVNRYGGQPMTLLLLDLDDFKQFNDAYGHIEGDEVLMRLGKVVKRCLRQTDSAYRYGGEEFTIILPMTTCKDAAVTAERIRTEFKKETFSPAPGQDVHLTMSIGLAQYKAQEDMKAFVNRVDQLMYRGKKNGKDSMCSDES